MFNFLSQKRRTVSPLKVSVSSWNLEKLCFYILRRIPHGIMWGKVDLLKIEASFTQLVSTHIVIPELQRVNFLLSCEIKQNLFFYDLWFIYRNSRAVAPNWVPLLAISFVWQKVKWIKDTLYIAISYL